MATFHYTFTVDAPLTAVADFHSRTDILRKLTPPPIIVQVHDFGEMAEGMMADFTLWFGPYPVRWLAEHIDVSPNGFTDVQREGLMAEWSHTHSFQPISADKTAVHEHIVYAYPTGWRGLIARLLFNKPALYGLFTYRKLVTRWSLRQS